MESNIEKIITIYFYKFKGGVDKIDKKCYTNFAVLEFGVGSSSFFPDFSGVNERICFT